MILFFFFFPLLVSWLGLYPTLKQKTGNTSYSEFCQLPVGMALLQEISWDQLSAIILMEEVWGLDLDLNFLQSFESVIFFFPKYSKFKL